MRLWDLESFQELQRFSGYADRVKCVRFSPSGQLAASCDTADPIVRLWDLNTGNLVREFKGHQDGVASVEFSRDGRYLLSSGGQLRIQDGGFVKNTKAKSIRLWDVATGQELLLIDGHDDFVSSVVFSPDGLKAVSGSGDGTVRVWKLFEDDKQ